MRSVRSAGHALLPGKGFVDWDGTVALLSNPFTHCFNVSYMITLTRSLSPATGSVLPIASRMLRSGIPVISDARFGVTEIGGRTSSLLDLSLMAGLITPWSSPSLTLAHQGVHRGTRVRCSPT